MRRLTLQDMTKFHILKAFSAKRPQEYNFDGRWDTAHHYAVAKNDVDNIGGRSLLSVWKPLANLSLSQQWFASGRGCGFQTCKGGWQVNQRRYITTEPVLFIYYTNNSYGEASCNPNNHQFGCYDLDCPAFIQVDNDYVLGLPFPKSSVVNSTIVYYQWAWILYKLRWWLSIYDSFRERKSWIGYYPIKVYGGGAMSSGAGSIQFGGEVTRVVNTTWPPMGSGEYAVDDLERVAVQQHIHYFAPDGREIAANLSVCVDSCCYSALLGNNANTDLYFGGPGGTNARCMIRS